MIVRPGVLQWRSALVIIDRDRNSFLKHWHDWCITYCMNNPTHNPEDAMNDQTHPMTTEQKNRFHKAVQRSIKAATLIAQAQTLLQEAAEYADNTSLSCFCMEWSDTIGKEFMGDEDMPPIGAQIQACSDEFNTSNQ